MGKGERGQTGVQIVDFLVCNIQRIDLQTLLVMRVVDDCKAEVIAMRRQEGNIANTQLRNMNIKRSIGNIEIICKRDNLSIRAE